MVPKADEAGKARCRVCNREIKHIHYTHRGSICHLCWEKMHGKETKVDTKYQGLWWTRKEYD